MKRKDYQKPTMQIVQLKQQQALLAGSDGDGELIPMEDPEDI